MSINLIIMALGGDSISISNVTANSIQVNPVDATAQYSLTSSGDIRATAGNNTLVDIGDWISPKGGASNFYEARATVTSGSLTTGTTGAWLGLGTTRTWTLTQSSAGLTSTCIFTVEIRRASDSVVVDSATITLTANKDISG